MRYGAWFMLAGLLCARTLEAQGTVVRPDAPLDPARAELRDALLVLRDSLNSIDAAAARLQRDYRSASPPSLLSRARVMRDACSSSARSISRARNMVLAANAPDQLRLKRQGEMTKALDQLRTVLTRCESEFTAMSQPGKGETVRGYGNDRAVRVLASLRRYEKTLGGFFAAMGIRVTPQGGEPRSLAG